MSVSIQIDNIIDLQKLIDEKSDSLNAENLKKANSKTALKLQALSKQTFLKKKDPFGNSWASLKSREGQTLRDGGRLFNSISSSSSEGSIRVFVEGSLSYAEVHNNGFKGIQNVKAHKRKITKAFGKSINPVSINVKAFIRVQNIPKRMFIPNEGIMPKKWLSIIEENVTENFK